MKMPQLSQNSIFTTSSAIVGGVGKAITAKPLLATITINGLSNVIIYAAASAGVGYVVKKVLDILSAKISDKCAQYKSQDDE